MGSRAERSAGILAGLLAMSAAAAPEAPAATTAAGGTAGAGRVVMFIGGARDNRGRCGPVRDYVGTRPAVPGLTLSYFGHGQEDAAVRFANGLLEGTTLSIVGHSWGGHAAIRVARRVRGRIAHLVGVDPVGMPFRGGREVPENVDHLVLVMAVPEEADGADAVEKAGKLIGGVPAAYRDSADTVITVPTSHGYFAEQYTAPGADGRCARDIVEGRAAGGEALSGTGLPAPDRLVHPAARDATRGAWGRVPYEGPWLVVAIESAGSLQARADREDVSYVRFKAYACASRPDWRTDILSGPVFQGTDGGSQVYLPVDLGAAVGRLAGRRHGLNELSELERAGEAGLCVTVYGGKWFGAEFSLPLQRVPAELVEGRLVPVDDGSKEKGPGGHEPPGPSMIR